MVARAGLRDRQVILGQVAALRESVARSAGEFENGALAALLWLLDGGPGPVTGAADRPPTVARTIVRELAAAEAMIYGTTTQRTDFARGVEHALMWAQFVTCSTPAGDTLNGPGSQDEGATRRPGPR
jgi:hypothetical protein